MIIGLTGTSGSGKDTVADYLKKKNFYYYSLSDVLRDECDKRGLLKERDNLIRIGNELREKFGPSVLAEKIIEKKNKEGVDNCVVVSIRNPKEVERLKEEEGFVLLNIDAPQKVRYERIYRRGREEDSVTFEKFKEQEELEMCGPGPNSQQLMKVAEMSDHNIDNSGTLEELYKKVDIILSRY